MGSKKKPHAHNDNINTKNGTGSKTKQQKLSPAGKKENEDVPKEPDKNMGRKPVKSKNKTSSSSGTTNAIISFFIVFISVLFASVAIIFSNPSLQSKLGEVINKYSTFQYSIVASVHDHSKDTGNNVIVKNNDNIDSTGSTSQDSQQGALTDYDKSEITNAQDNEIRSKLDSTDSLYAKGEYPQAKFNYDEILRRHPSSPRALYGKAVTLNKMAELERSNIFLEESINVYDKLIREKDTPDVLVLIAGKELIKLQNFRGWSGKALVTSRYLVNRFPSNTTLKNDLGVSLLLTNKMNEAKKVFQEVLNLNNEDGFSKVHLGFIYKNENLELAVQLLSEGLKTDAPGTRDGRFYFHLGDALVRLRRPEEARDVYMEGAKKGLLLSADQRSLYNVGNLTARPWWTPEQTGYQQYLQLLQDNWKVIRDEGLANMDPKRGAFILEQENLRESGDWKQFTLFSQGRKDKKNCERVPKTCNLIDQIPDAKSCLRGQVKFSVMHPGVHVWPHTGPTNCRLRAHLGLVIPNGPKIRVVNETRTWKEGEIIVFDDSFEHEVWHSGDSMRLVLIVDFWHPEITSQLKRTLSPI